MIRVYQLDKWRSNYYYINKFMYFLFFCFYFLLLFFYFCYFLFFFIGIYFDLFVFAIGFPPFFVSLWPCIGVMWGLEIMLLFYFFIFFFYVFGGGFVFILSFCFCFDYDFFRLFYAFDGGFIFVCLFCICVDYDKCNVWLMIMMLLTITEMLFVFSFFFRLCVYDLMVVVIISYFVRYVKVLFEECFQWWLRLFLLLVLCFLWCFVFMSTPISTMLMFVISSFVLCIIISRIKWFMYFCFLFFDFVLGLLEVNIFCFFIFGMARNRYDKEKFQMQRFKMMKYEIL